MTKHFLSAEQAFICRAVFLTKIALRSMARFISCNFIIILCLTKNTNNCEMTNDTRCHGGNWEQYFDPKPKHISNKVCLTINNNNINDNNFFVSEC